MAVSNDKVRVTVTLSVDRLQQVDALAARLGITRSAVCALLIAQYFDKEDVIL